MITFLVEVTDAGEFNLDFTWSIYKSIEFHKWYYKDNCNYNYVKVKKTDEETIFNFHSTNTNAIPVGSIEYTHRFMKFKNIPIPEPLNIPECLQKPDFLKRTVFNSSIDTLNWKKPWFIKPLCEVKKFTGFISKDKETAFLFEPSLKEDEKVFASEPIDIISEYRCIVNHNELLGVQYYSGDFTIFPDIKKIKKIISNYDKLIYTLDIGITSNGDTVIIELHNFYSVGLYGYCNFDEIPKLFSGWFQEYINAI